MTPSSSASPSKRSLPHSHHHTLKEQTPSDSAHHPPARNIPPPVPSPPPLAARYSRPPNFELPNKPDTFDNAFIMPNHESQWIFPPDAMQHTPSLRHGVSVAEERSRRAKGVNFILQAAVMLKLPQTTICTAAVYFHRFYMRNSLDNGHGSGFHHYPIAATALFLATKAEEQCRKTKDIVISIAKVAQKNPDLAIDEQSKEFWRWKDNILQFEETMLELLTFDIHINSPYRLLSPLFEMFNIHENRKLRNLAWAFLNDSCLTGLCVLQPAKDIAVAALFFALSHDGRKLSDDEDGTPWWEQAGGTPEKIAQAMDIMYDLYADNPLGKKDNPYTRSPTDSSERLERTRRRSENGINSQSQSDIGTPGSQGLASPDIDRPEHANGNGIKKEEGEATPNGKSSEKEDGSSDALLKEAANDPATHETTAGDTAPTVTNGASTDHPETTPKVSPKRKADEMADEGEINGDSASKRPRLEDGVKAEQEKSDEEEEGELEE